jgi:F0F1-type ATP synthase membrane subunit c/vacuolar-type H+-ATPase subunit K
VTLAQQQQQQRQQIGLIWGAMLSTVAVYGLVCAIAVRSAAAEATADTTWIRYWLSAAGVVLGALSVWWQRHFLATDPSPPVALGFVQMQRHGIVTWALSEAVGICGVLTAFLLDDAREYIPFGAAAAALLLLHRPSNLPWARLVSSGLQPGESL